MPIDTHISGADEFVKLNREVFGSLAYHELSNSARAVFIAMLFSKDIYNDHDVFRFTFEQAKSLNVCAGSDTFVAAKKMLVEHGLIDQISVGGIKVRAKFKLSGRWRDYGKDDFEVIKYKNCVRNGGNRHE